MKYFFFPIIAILQGRKQSGLIRISGPLLEPEPTIYIQDQSDL